SSAGIGATVQVALISNSVNARVGHRNANAGATTLHLSGPLSIRAKNRTETESYVVVGAIGGTAGIGAQFSGIIVSNTVTAELDNAHTTISTATAEDGRVTVAAEESDAINVVVGGLSGGGSAGVGAAVSLVTLKSSTAAQIAGGSLTTPGAVDVMALSIRDVSPITVTASLGGQVGIAGTVGVVLIGSGATTDQMSVLNSGATQGDSSSGTLGNAGAASGTDVVGEVSGGVDGISAQSLNANITAGEINIGAAAHTSVKNIVGALAVGLGGGGLGAGVGFTEVEQRVTAKTEGGTLTAPTIAIVASAGDRGSGRTAETLGAAGAGGLYVGLGAAVADSRVENVILAELGSRTDSGGTNTGTISVTASDTSSMASYGYGFAGGAAAVGISLGFAQKSSQISARIADATVVTNFAGVAVVASGGGSVSASTIAGA
ncbi:MAG: hypothetical protein Q8M31_22345, partial [Beijerinckiaceae bacterium]|nr:hypothetical protein [Beijerinckiaceae bacterium]